MSDSVDKDEQEKVRMSSQQRLLESLLRNDLLEFDSLLMDSGVDPNYNYVNYESDGEKYSGTCIEIASAKSDRAEFVKSLLLFGANPNVNVILREPIHVAAESGNYEALDFLLADKRTNVNALDPAGDTALHIAIRGFKNVESDLSRYEKCIEILIQHPDIDINFKNLRGVVPIYEALLQGARGAIILILTKGKYLVDVDMLVDNLQTVRQAISSTYPDLRDLLPASEIPPSLPDRYSKLLSSAVNGEVETFKYMLNQVDSEGNAVVDPNHWFGRPHNSRLLDMVCGDRKLGIFAEALIYADANPNIINPVTGRSPIHLAAEACNFAALEALCEADKLEVNILDKDGRSALHLLVGNTNEIEAERIRCVSLLLSHQKINVNICDKNGRTPIFLAALVNDEAMVKELLEISGDKVDLLTSQETDKRKSVCDLLISRFPELEYRIAEIKTRESYQSYLKNLLFQYLYGRQSKEFVAKFHEASDKREHIDVNKLDDGNDTLLQCAVIHGMEDAVRAILLNGADPFRVTRNNPVPPISLAIDRQYIEIFYTIVSFSNKEVETPDNKRQTPLHHAAKLQNTEALSKILEVGCHVNTRDGKGNTALHIAARKRHLESVKLLLKHKANVNFRNAKGDTALHFACRKDDKQIMMELLTHGANINIRNVLDKEPLTMNAMESLLDSCLKTNNMSPENLKHEIILDYTLLLAQGVDCTSQNPKEITDEDKQNEESFQLRPKFDDVHCAEMTFMNDLAHSKACSSLVKHPLIKAFLQLKWQRVKAYYYANLAIYAVFVILLNLFIQYGLHGNSTSAIYLSFLLIPFLLYFISREILQFIMGRRRYIDDTENFVDISLIVITVTVMFSESLRSPVKEMMRITATLLSWTELVLITGRHPKLSKNVKIFKMIAKTYASLFISYIFIIFAFAFSFRILFRGNADLNVSYFFETPGQSIFKTFLMMLGDYSTSPAMYITSSGFVTHITVMLFLFIIVLVLVNLLTALTVSDIQVFKVKAEELSIASRIKLIYEIEDILLEGRKVCNKYTYVTRFVNLIHRNLKKVNFFNRNFNRTCLFSKSNNFKVIRILPNQRGRVITNEKCVYEWKISNKLLGIIIERMSNKGRMSENDKLKEYVRQFQRGMTNVEKVNERTLADVKKLRYDCDKNYESINVLLKKLENVSVREDQQNYQSQDDAGIGNIENKISGLEKQIADHVSQLSSELQAQDDEFRSRVGKINDQVEALNHNLSNIDERLVQSMEQSQLLQAANTSKYESLEMSEAECKKLLMQVLEILQRRRKN